MVTVRARSYFSKFASSLFVLALLSAACGSSGARLDRTAENLGLSEPKQVGGPLPSVVVLSGGGTGDVLHVYIEGDGIPWVREKWIAADPNPRDLLMLRLMAMDPSPSIYLGRPCYHGASELAPCSAWHWTEGRYSEEVVDSLSLTLADHVKRGRRRRLVLIGHSGGGTLAMLLADRLEDVESVITLAGNLDPDAWCELHAYSPLTGSLNPSLRRPLDGRIRQLHLVGDGDSVVPKELIEDAIAHQPGARLQVLSGCDHTSCWETIWPDILLEERERR
jgi:pimeloyl-ACP methyl ester carboxylesterase